MQTDERLGPCISIAKKKTPQCCCLTRPSADSSCCDALCNVWSCLSVRCSVLSPPSLPCHAHCMLSRLDTMTWQHCYACLGFSARLPAGFVPLRQASRCPTHASPQIVRTFLRLPAHLFDVHTQAASIHIRIRQKQGIGLPSPFCISCGSRPPSASAQHTLVYIVQAGLEYHCGWGNLQLTTQQQLGQFLWMHARHAARGSWSASGRRTCSADGYVQDRPQRQGWLMGIGRRIVHLLQAGFVYATQPCRGHGERNAKRVVQVVHALCRWGSCLTTVHELACGPAS